MGTKNTKVVVEEAVDNMPVVENVEEKVTKPVKPAKKVGVVKPAKLNMRFSANAEAAIVTVLDKDSKVTVIDDTDSKWLFVKQGKNEGFVMKEFVEI